jgi:carboxyl-terminal processing protease
MKQSATKISLPLFLSISMIAGIFIGYKMRDSFPNNGFFSLKHQSPVEEMMQLIQNKYVDDVNAKALADTAIEAILSKLDPHSVYISAAELADVNDEINGNFYGIGIKYEVYHDTLYVTEVLKDGPADKAKLQIGDKIITANKKKISGNKISIEEMRNLLRGERNTELSVLVIRNSKSLTVPIKRDLIPINSIDAAYMVDNKTGFIKINQFSTHTYKEFMIELTALKKAGMQKLILDLRDNGGGVLDQAIEIVD